MLLKNESVWSLKEKNNTWFSYFCNVGEYLNICSIFHKGIISSVLCGYEVQMNMYLFDFEQKYTFKMIWSSHVPTIIYNNIYNNYHVLAGKLQFS